jgi:hypothetical protein
MNRFSFIILSAFLFSFTINSFAQKDSQKPIIYYKDNYKKKKDTLPYGLNFGMNRLQVEQLLGPPDVVGSKALRVIYLKKNLFIIYNDSDPEKAKMESIEIDKNSSSVDDSLTITKGMTLKYNIVHNYDSMKLNVMIREVSNQVIFDFTLRSLNSFYGRVIMTPNALKNGTKQYNYTRQGDVTLTNATAIWMSQYVYTTLKDSGEIKMAPDGKEKVYKRVRYQDYEVIKDGKKISIPAFMVLSDGDNPKDMFLIADNKNFPIILQMNLGFKFDLSEIDSEEIPANQK